MTRFLLFFLIHTVATIGAAETSSAQKIFSCRSVHSAFDPTYEQGAEIFMDLYYDANTQQASMMVKPAEHPDFILLKPQTSTRALVDLAGSSAFMAWQEAGWKATVSLVYLGGPWGLVARIPKEVATPAELPGEIELMCTETPALEEIFNFSPTLKKP